MNLSEFFVRDFREAAPYINYLRGKTLVIGIAGSLLEGATLRTLAADLNLLASLGVRLVVVHGSRSQISALAETRVANISGGFTSTVRFAGSSSAQANI